MKSFDSETCGWVSATALFFQPQVGFKKSFASFIETENVCLASYFTVNKIADATLRLGNETRGSEDELNQKCKERILFLFWENATSTNRSAGTFDIDHNLAFCFPYLTSNSITP